MIRAGLVLLLLLASAHAQAKKVTDPFRPLDNRTRRPFVAPGWQSRIGEELVRLRLHRTDPVALDSALPLMEKLGRLNDFSTWLSFLPGDDPDLSAIRGYVALQTIGNFFDFPAGMPSRSSPFGSFSPHPLQDARPDEACSMNALLLSVFCFLSDMAPHCTGCRRSRKAAMHPVNAGECSCS